MEMNTLFVPTLCFISPRVENHVLALIKLIQRVSRGGIVRRRLLREKKEREAKEWRMKLDEAAIFIQKRWRGYVMWF